MVAKTVREITGSRINKNWAQGHFTKKAKMLVNTSGDAKKKILTVSLMLQK
jgi:hypothetical protein